MNEPTLAEVRADVAFLAQNVADLGKELLWLSDELAAVKCALLELHPQFAGAYKAYETALRTTFDGETADDKRNRVLAVLLRGLKPPGTVQ